MTKTKKISTESSQKLLMFDHDGTICNSNSNTFESIKQAVITTSRFFVDDFTDEHIDWPAVFSETTGTTERYLIKVILNLIPVPISKHKLFEEMYYKSRKNWYHNMIELKECVWDTYYPDAEKLLIDTDKMNKGNLIKYLVTGNPIQVIEERIPQHIRYNFNNPDGSLRGTFGNEGLTRKDLILLNIEKAIKNDGFKPIKNGNNIITNAYYIADSKNDLYAGIEARVRTVWIPSRSLQNLMQEESKQDIKIFKQLLPNSFITTNNLSSPEVYSFIGV